MQDYRKLKVWEKAHALVLAVYSVTRAFPREETYGIVAQLRRTSTAIPMKIAEASGQDSEQDFSRLISNAIGAGKELEYLFLLAKDLQFLPIAEYDAYLPKVEEVIKMLYGLLRRTH